MLSILFYTDTPNVGGAEKQMGLLAKYLKLRGISISLVYGKYSALGRHPEFLSGYDRTFFLNAAHKHDPRHYFGLKKILRMEKFDLVHLHLWNPGACRYAFFAATRAGVPVITTEHDPFELYGLKRWIKKACLRRTAHTIAVSQDNQADLQAWYGIPDDRITVVFNGIELEPFLNNQVRANLPVHSGDTVITCVAELHERKGHDDLLKAFQRLGSAFPKLHLMLVGSGPRQKELQKNWGSNYRIHFLGWRDDIPQILKASDLFVLPSPKEAFGLSVLEAMASGVAVIATNSGGLKDIIENGKSGLLVPPANPEKMAEAIITLLCNPNQKRDLEEAALKRVQSFSAERMANETLKIYSSVLRRTLSPFQSAS